MGFYDYFCDDCGEPYEIYQRMFDKHVYRCPKCKRMARRIYSATVFFFDFKDGWDMGLGRNVDTKKERETIMREKGLRRIRD